MLYSNELNTEDNLNSSLHIPYFLNFDFYKSNFVKSADNSFILYYTDSILLNIDLQSKKLNWYKQFDKSVRIADVQINSDNQISFIKQQQSHNEIATLSNKNYTEFSELKLKDFIIKHKLIQMDDSSDILLVINDSFQLTLYKDNLLIKNISKNIVQDVNNELIQKENKIINIEYIREQNLILIIFDNGIIAYYEINIFYHEEAYSNDINLEYKNYINLNYNDINQSVYYDIKIITNNYICNNDMKIADDKDKITTLLIICGNKKIINKISSFIYFFKIEEGKFENNNINNNQISFENKEIIDSSIIKSNYNNNENIYNYIFVLFKIVENNIKNKLYYSTEYSNLFHWYNLEQEINDKGFQELENFEDISQAQIFINNIKCFGNNNNNKFSINYLKIGNNIKIIDSKDENRIKNQLEINELINSNNYNDYISYVNSINYNEHDYKIFIENKYNQNYNIDILNNIKDEKIDFFLLNLIANKALFKIKNYLMKRDTLNTNFIFPISLPYTTCKFLFKEIVHKIKRYDERNDYIESLLNILINILKILKNRNRIYNEKLYEGDEKILIKQEWELNSFIFNIECILFIYKIQNLSKKNFDKGFEYGNELKHTFFNIFAFKNKKKEENIIEDKNDDDESQEDMNNQTILEEIKNLHKTYMNCFSEEKLIKIFYILSEVGIKFESFLYYIKFIIFNYYFYCFLYKEGGNNLDNILLYENDYFKTIKPEYESYSKISKALFDFDKNGTNIRIFELIKFLQYIIKENIITNNELNKKLNQEKIIYNLITNLISHEFNDECLSIGNSICSSLTTFDEFNAFLLAILKVKDYPLAYSFINKCLWINLDKHKTNDKIKIFFDSMDYIEIRNLYNNFYEYLIKNKAIDYLFKLSLNFIEIYIFKELCHKKYKQLLIIYHIIIGNVKEAKFFFKEYSKIYNSESQILYANLIKYYELLIGKKQEDETADNKIDALTEGKKLLIKIDEDKQRIYLKDNDMNNEKIDTLFSLSQLSSSIAENQIISGQYLDSRDYNKLPKKLIQKLYDSFKRGFFSDYISDKIN